MSCSVFHIKCHFGYVQHLAKYERAVKIDHVLNHKRPATVIQRLDTAHTILSPNKCQLLILPWSTNFLPTKVIELRYFLGKNNDDVALMQETKPAHKDPTPLIEEYDYIRQNRQGNRTIHLRGDQCLCNVEQSLCFAMSTFSKSVGRQSDIESTKFENDFICSH